MSSIRRFLVLVLIATITLINFVAALQGFRSGMAEAEQLFDSQLADIAGVLSLTAGQGDAGNPQSPDGGSILFQVWRDGVLESASADAPVDPIAPFTGGYKDVNVAGYRWRAFSLFVPQSNRWLIVAERADLRFALAESVITESILPIVLGLPLVGLLIWLIVGRGLSPLRDLATEMSGKRSDDLSPVSAREPPQELALLIDSINDLLRRLAAAFEREKRFAADAAHELRTPISVLKVQLHNLRHDADDDDGKLGSLQKAVDRMGHSVEQVLTLYRTTPEQFAARFVELDLAGLAREIIAEMFPQLETLQQQIELVGDDIALRGDAFAIRTMLKNLIENASKYSGERGNIRVTLRRESTGVVVIVEDSGPGIPADQHERVFERFVRGAEYGIDSGGDAEVDGSGIGLAIVQHIAEIHGAAISLGESGFSSGLAVIVTFPDRMPGEWKGSA